jgi:hydrogenase maturation protein HypF
MASMVETRTSPAQQLIGASIRVTGIVQGVGFRPFVFGLATELGLLGWIRNTSGGVELELDGTARSLDEFRRKLNEEAPALAVIDGIDVTSRPPNGYSEFVIKSSEATPESFQPISPDVSICEDCLREMLDPDDRRYRYSFINCTNCGPRFTIIQKVPYDRPLTTMSWFAMCSDCRLEYENPLNRRFHAQPIACPACGPKVWLEGERASQDPIADARELLSQGKILAVKGLGGFHIACDAASAQAVGRLRLRKGRPAKPFAVMMASIEIVRKYCELGEMEQRWLTRRERPIVILHRKQNCPLAEELAPGQNSIGVMLPYTPLHYLLIKPDVDFPEALVMTSGNLSDHPIVYTNAGAREQLSQIADGFLMHDRDIHIGCDDSILRIESENEYLIRRSRGISPAPLRLAWNSAPILAVGAELKNTFCFTSGERALLSQHIGNLENYEVLNSYERSLDHFEQLFRIKPEVLAYDLHPDYLATRYALTRAEQEGIPAIGVQHHHAHIAACMAEHGLDQGHVLGMVFDGTGYGTDGAIWGGEVLLADYQNFVRLAHLRSVPLLGGDAAVKHPWRQALVWLDQCDIEWTSSNFPVSQPDLDILRQQLEGGINAPPTSSMGRLFDAVSALLGICHTVTYEGQAAIELEQFADEAEPGSYEFALSENVLDPRPVIHSLMLDLKKGTDPSLIAARFHNAVSDSVVSVAERSREQYGVRRVVLSGGVWQNMKLLRRSLTALQKAEFQAYVHQKVPCNDGGIALGQAAVAHFSLRQK